MNFKNLKFTHILSASQPAVRPGFASCMAPKFLRSKGNRIRFTKPLFQKAFVH